MSAAHRAQGYATLVDPATPVAQEWDTITCWHCQRIVFLKKDPGAWCMRCMRAICVTCDNGACVPFEKRLERQEQRGRMLRQMGF